MKDILIVLALQILVAGGIILIVESCTRNHRTNSDGSLNPIEVESVVLFQDSCCGIKTIKYCGHRYVMIDHDFIHDPDCPCHGIYHKVKGGTDYD